MDQEPLLFFHPSSVAGEAAAAAHYPVAGDEDGDGVVGHSAPHRLGGHGASPPLGGGFFGKAAIGGYLPIGNNQQQPPTPPADGHISETCLSQWWMCPFQVDGVEYSCAEQFMMAEKARMFGDQEMLAKIMKASHPKEMKAYGRAVTNFDKESWATSC